MKAALFYEPGTPLQVEDVAIGEPRDEEVLVRLHTSGVCHSDYHVILGEWSQPSPIVLGHEGSGIVEAVGPHVRDVAPGDHVILSWYASCRRCAYCVSGRPQLCPAPGRTAMRGLLPDGTTRLSIRGWPLYSYLAVASFAEYTVVPESGAIKIRPDMPLDRAALIGCAVTTGVGAVINTARVEPGSTTLVIGCGGVGLSVIQGAVLSSARRIIAADVHENKLRAAARFGATDLINSGQDDLLAAVQDLTGGHGVDYAFEAIGYPPTIELAYTAIAPGGTAVVVGMTPEGSRISIDPYILADSEKTLKGSNYGSARPSIDFPRLIEWYMAGKIDLDGLVSETVTLADLDEAFARMGRGETVRTLVRLSE